MKNESSERASCLGTKDRQARLLSWVVLAVFLGSAPSLLWLSDRTFSVVAPSLFAAQTIAMAVAVHRRPEHDRGTWMAWQCGVALLIINSLAIPRYRMAQHGSIWGALTVGALVLEMACFTAGTARSFRPEMDLVGLPLVEFTETSPTALSPTVLIVLVLVDGALAGLALGPWSVSRVVFVLALAVAVQTVAIVWLSGTLLGFLQELGLLKDRRLRHELRTALKQGLLIAHFQPIVRSTDRQVVGYETLVRWTHLRLGLLPAQHFIALAESERLLSSIDRRLIS